MNRWVAKSLRFEGIDVDSLIESERALAKEKARTSRASYQEGTKKVKAAGAEAHKLAFISELLKKKGPPRSSMPSVATMKAMKKVLRSSMPSVATMKAMKKVLRSPMRSVAAMKAMKAKTY